MHDRLDCVTGNQSYLPASGALRQHDVCRLGHLIAFLCVPVWHTLLHLPAAWAHLLAPSKSASLCSCGFMPGSVGSSCLTHACLEGCQF